LYSIPFVRNRSAIFRIFHTLIALVIVGQCAASLALAVNEAWHESVHHHDGEEDHDCPVVQLAHGFWDAPVSPIFAVPCPPPLSAALNFPDTARMGAALRVSSSVLEHAPPAVG
jgi:hypothetical protein